MKLSIRHETHYEYSAPLQYALQQLCLTPQANAHQEVEAWQLSAPGPLTTANMNAMSGCRMART